MKVFTLLILGALAGAAGYLFGTEAGRQRKDDLLKKARKGTDAAKVAAGDAADTVADTATRLADQATEAANDAMDQLKA